MRVVKSEVLEMIKERPVEFGHWVGFKDLTDIHNEWLKDFLFGTEDMTLQAHRGSFKTTTLSLFFTLHILIRPQENIIYFRKSDNLVREIMRQTKNIMQSGCYQYMVQAIYGKELKFYKDSETEIKTNLGMTAAGISQITGLGIGGSITGIHGDVICTDDIVTLSDRLSAAERNRTKTAYMELQNIKNRNGRIINSGTPWHVDDCFSIMPKAKKYTWKDTGLISEEQAEELKQHMTNSLFAANYELRHIPADDVIFIDPQTGYDPELAKDGITHVDAAYYGEDYTAMSIVMRHDGNFYVFGKCWRKHIEYCMDDIVRYHEEYRSKFLYNERNPDKGYVCGEFRKLGVKTRGYDESENKVYKITSVLKFAWKNVYFVEGTDEEYIQQICNYNEYAAHDDCPDSLASAIREWNKKKTTTYKSLWDETL